MIFSGAGNLSWWATSLCTGEKSRVLNCPSPVPLSFMRHKLGIKSAAGQKAERQGREAIKAFSDAHPSLDYVFTNPKELAVVDGFVIDARRNTLYGVVEAKARDLTEKKLKGDYDNKWMLSVAKLERGRLMSEMLCIPFIGILRFNPDNKFLVIQLTDKKGSYVVEYEEREIITQATVYGGKKLELNAFIPMEEAKEYKL